MPKSSPDVVIKDEETNCLSESSSVCPSTAVVIDRKTAMKIMETRFLVFIGFPSFLRIVLSLAHLNSMAKTAELRIIVL